MSKGSILVLGGASDMGLAIAHRFAKEGFDVQLAARRPDELERAKADLEVRYAVAVTLHAFDALDFHAHESFMASRSIRIDSLEKLCASSRIISAL